MRNLLVLAAAFAVCALVAVGSASAHGTTCSISPSVVAVGDTYVVTATNYLTTQSTTLVVTDPSGATSKTSIAKQAQVGLYPDLAVLQLSFVAAAPSGVWTYTFYRHGPLSGADYLAGCELTVQ